MEQTQTHIFPEEKEALHEPMIQLELEDVGDLEGVLRDYYLSQIKKIDRRKDRKLARKLIENHLVLPKSRQRTSKDAAYIREKLGIEPFLLDQLEDSRLIRRISKRGMNPIYEVSHDSLVEPILAGKQSREAIALFLRRIWKWVLLFLLLWFLFGMFFQKQFSVIPDLPKEPQKVSVDMAPQLLGIGDELGPITLSLPPVVLGQSVRGTDSILISLPLDMMKLPVENARSIPDGAAGEGGERTETSAPQDTIPIRFLTPIEVPIAASNQDEFYQAFTNVVVPLAFTSDDSPESGGKQLFATLSGNLRLLLNSSDTGSDQGQLARAGRARGIDNLRTAPINLALGDTSIKASQAMQSVPIEMKLRLTDLFESMEEKNKVRNTLGDRELNLRYQVQVQPSAVKPAAPQIQYPAVQGIEVQFSDGTSKFIPSGSVPALAGGNAAGVGTVQTHIVAPGETLFSIAKKYGMVDEKGNTSTEQLKQLNGLQGNSISVGQSLRVLVR